MAGFIDIACNFTHESFKDNLEIAFQKNKVSNKIKQLIYLWYGV